jgi:hypothetical protein
MVLRLRSERRLNIPLLEISDREKISLKNLGLQPPYPQPLSFSAAAQGDKIFKIHSSEFRCRLSLRWKMDESSAA